MNPQNQRVNIEQLQNSLKLLYAKVELWEQKIATFKHRAVKERALISAIVEVQLKDKPSQWNGHPLHDYLTAHKNNTEAEEQLMQITIAELKSQVAITEAVPIADPGKLRLS